MTFRRLARSGYVAPRVVLAVGALALAACSDTPVVERPAPDARRALHEGALRTLTAGPADLIVRVSSPTAAYSVRGAIDIRTERFRVHARIARTPTTHAPKSLELVGLKGESYQLVHSEPGLQNLGEAGCAVDPHAPIGSLGGAASVQESVSLVGIAIALLRYSPPKVTVSERRPGGAVVYRVVVDPRKVGSLKPALGDEWVPIDPPRLARHLRPIEVTVGANGLIRRLSMELRRFPPPSGRQYGREARRERVAISVALSDFGRALRIRLPRCVAME